VQVIIKNKKVAIIKVKQYAYSKRLVLLMIQIYILCCSIHNLSIACCKIGLLLLMLIALKCSQPIYFFIDLTTNSEL
jgi:hypothetical protein